MESKDRRERYCSDVAACVERRGQRTEETRVAEGKRRRHQNEECDVTVASAQRTTKQNNKRDDDRFRKLHFSILKPSGAFE